MYVLILVLINVKIVAKLLRETMAVYLHLVEFHLSTAWLDIINLIQGALLHLHPFPQLH